MKSLDIANAAQYLAAKQFQGRTITDNDLNLFNLAQDIIDDTRLRLGKPANIELEYSNSPRHLLALSKDMRTVGIMRDKQIFVGSQADLRSKSTELMQVAALALLYGKGNCGDFGTVALVSALEALTTQNPQREIGNNGDQGLPQVGRTRPLDITLLRKVATEVDHVWLELKNNSHGSNHRRSDDTHLVADAWSQRQFPIFAEDMDEKFTPNRTSHSISKNQDRLLEIFNETFIKVHDENPDPMRELRERLTPGLRQLAADIREQPFTAALVREGAYNPVQSDIIDPSFDKATKQAELRAAKQLYKHKAGPFAPEAATDFKKKPLAMVKEGSPLRQHFDLVHQFRTVSFARRLGQSIAQSVESANEPSRLR